jgi:hypothetical protein
MHLGEKLFNTLASTCFCPCCGRMGLGRSGTEMEVDGCEILQETNDHERHLVVGELAPSVSNRICRKGWVVLSPVGLGKFVGQH